MFTPSPLLCRKGKGGDGSGPKSYGYKLPQLFPHRKTPLYRHNSENKINNNDDDKGFTVDR